MSAVVGSMCLSKQSMHRSLRQSKHPTSAFFLPHDWQTLVAYFLW
jgi:hypothetical protein